MLEGSIQLCSMSNKHPTGAHEEEKTMKQTSVPRRLLSLLLAVVLCLSLVPLTVFAGEAVSVAEWNYAAAPSGLPAAATGGVDTGATLDLTGAGIVGYSSNSISANSWNNGGYWIMKVSTIDYENLTFTAKMRSSNTGPKNFQLSYSIDGGTNWTNVGEPVALTTTLSAKYSGVSLPAEAANCASVWLKLEMIGTTAVGGNEVASGGTSNINNIVVSGTKIAGLEATLDEVTPAESHSGELGTGTVLTLSTEGFTGVTYQVSTDGTTWSDLAGNTYTIPESAEARTYHYYFRAVKDGVTSKTLDVTFTVFSVSTVAEALAMADNTANVTVKGVITALDGNNIYVQDATGGICVRVSGTPADVKLGDTIIGTGTRKTYSGMPQLSNSTYEKSSGLTLTAKKTTIGALTTADICTYVELTGVEVTQVKDGSKPTITVTDGTNSIQIYNAIVGKNEDGSWAVQVGDKLTVKAAVGVYNTTLQLRNTVAEEITVTEPATGIVVSNARIEGTAEVGATLTFSLDPAVEGATFEVKLDDGAFEAVTGNTYVIPEGNPGKHTVAVRGVLDGKYSKVASVEYTIAGGDTYVQTTSLTAGDYVMVVSFGGKYYAMTSNLSNGRLAAVEVSVADGKIVAPDLPVWTVAKVEGGVTLLNGSNYLAHTSGTNLKLDTAASTWSVEEKEGTFLFCNSANRAPAFQGGTTNKFGAYATSNKTNASYAFYFMLFQKAEDPAKVDTLSDLDKVYLYHPTSKMVLTETASGSKLSGIEGTVTDDKLTVADGMTELVVSYNAETGYYQFVNAEGKYLTSGATGNSLTFATESSDYSLWALESAEGGCYIKNVNAAYNSTPQYMEYYKGFTTYSLKTGGAAYTFQFYKSGKAASLPVYTPEVVEPDESFAGLTELTDGQKVVVYAPNAVLAMTASANRDRLTGTAGKVVENVLTTNASAVELTVVKNADGSFSFVNADGEYMVTGASGNCLVLDKANGYECWKAEKNASGFILYNTKANYNGSYDYAIEAYGGNFTTYGYKSSDEALFTLQFFDAAQVKYVVDYPTDKMLEGVIAAWGGGGPIEGNESATTVYGDWYVDNDQQDQSAKLTVKAGGKDIAPYYNPGSKYYMGGQNIGSAAGDYVQFAVNTAGWGDMTLKFRLRVTGAAAGSYQLCYSTDNGASFANFESGSYAYSYFNYSSQNEIGNGSITDGIASIGQYVAKAGAYVTFTFDVPTGAENFENLLIRLVPGTVRADTDTTKTISGNIRMDSVKLTGYPINAEGFTDYVEVTPDGVDTDVASGTPLTMTCDTAGATIYYRFNDGQWLTYDESNKPTVPEELPAHLEVRAESEGNQKSITRVLTYAKGTVQAVKVTPNGGAIFIDGEAKNVTLSCETEGATIYYSLSTWEKVENDAGEYVDKFEVYDPETTVITLEKGFGELIVKAYAEKESFTTSNVVTRTFTERTQENYGVFFGQLHSHTSYSDGAGTCAEAFQHATRLHETTDTLDFLAVTDHSNSFDNDTSANINDGSMSTEWVEGHALADRYTTDEFVGIYGYEMTWSNGLGHMNTFNSNGFQSRNQEAYKTYSTALQNYYAALKTDSGTISQFNHPGTTFGDFSDFSYYDQEIDSLITLVEVGNGEGAIGSSGYFPSYEYYTRALDKGWHVAPTNNQDNHKGNWGNSNTGRTVVLADALTRDNIYDALRNYRVYATEDNDLSIIYTLDGNVMGTILTAGDVSDTVTLSVALEDPTDSGIGKVEVIVNGGLSIASQNVTTASGTVTFEVPADYSYYYIKVTQPDKDIAVTAPVWVGEVEACGISTFTADSDLAVQDEPVDLKLDMFNNEKTDLQIQSIEFSVDGEVIHTADLSELKAVKKMGTASYSFSYTYSGVGETEYLATVRGTLNGVEKVYTEKLTVTYYPDEMVTRVIIDGTHGNDYVNGYYGGNMGNFISLAAGSQIQATIVTDEITPEMLANCDLLVVSAPAKTSGTGNTGSYKPSPFSDEFIAMVADFVANGGNLVTCGLADYQDSRINSEYHSAYQINRLLAGVGSKLSLNDDEAYDMVNNGGENQPYRLYPATFNTDSQWLDGLREGQVYSAYSGCTVNAPEGTTWLVKGFDTTYSIDSDKDRTGNNGSKDDSGNNIVVDKGNAVFLACEDMPGGGTVFAASTVFLSNFEISAEMDNWDSLPYANRTVAENILSAIRKELPLSNIVDVRNGNNRDMFRIQGYVTAGTANENNKFFDAIYLQDETAGITVFPFAELGLELGTKMEIVGYRDEYQGDAEIQIMSFKILDEEKNVIAPTKMSPKDAMDYDNNGGKLIQTEGIVREVLVENGIVSQFELEDEEGNRAKIFIDGYILSGTTGKNELASIIVEGNKVSAVGLLYKHPEGSSDVSVAVLRVRDCDEIVLLEAFTHPDGWAFEDGKWYFYEDGEAVTGWKLVKGKWYLFDSTGVMQTGWQLVNGKWYYLDGNGAMRTGWTQIAGKWYYLDRSGAMVTGWKYISRKWYFFDITGAMKTGWQRINGTWYYLTENGDMLTGWLKEGTTWYYLKPNGAMACGETLNIGGVDYTFNVAGAWVVLRGTMETLTVM